MSALKEDDGLRAQVELARSLGISHKRAYGGWLPSTTYRRTGDDEWTAIEAQEWDATEVALMEALAELEARTCKGCGGDLAEELTDKPPYEDDGDGYYHRVHAYWCRGCVDQARYQRQVDRDQEKVAGTALDMIPQAMRTSLERLPIPTD